MRRSSPLLHSAVLGLAMVVGGAAQSCSDPVHDSLVQSLGPEVPGVPPGEYHRAGQPCTACHGPEGPAQTQFSLAGTVFWQQSSVVGVNQAVVSVIDSFGAQTQVTTNCVGNFFVRPADYTPRFPILVSAYSGDAKYGSGMFTQIGRATSCAECHSDPTNYNAVGHIYLTTAATIPAEASQNTSCPADPNVADYGSGGGL